MDMHLTKEEIRMGLRTMAIMRTIHEDQKDLIKEIIGPNLEDVCNIT